MKWFKFLKHGGSRYNKWIWQSYTWEEAKKEILTAIERAEKASNSKP